MAATKKKASFWEREDVKAATTGGKYLTAPEKAALIDSGTAVQIVAVRYDEKNQYQGEPKPGFVVTLLVDGAERLYRFGLSESDNPSSRDNLLGALIDYFDEGGSDAITVVLRKSEKGFVSIENAEA